MRRAAATLGLFAAACVLAGVDPAWAAKSRTPVTSSVKKLRIPAQELRIRVRALIRPTLGIVEESADRSLREATDPAVRRGNVVWKIETTTTLLTAMLRNDPVLALADAWGYAFQVESLLARPEVAARYGKYAPDASAAMAQIRAKFRDFAASVQDGATAEAFEAAIRQWADRNPIEGALYRRPSVDFEFATVLATSGSGGAFAALGNLDETTADLTTRMDLYTMYFPRLARWEAELAVNDLAQGIDPKGLIADIDRVTQAADRIATVAEGVPELAARERSAALDAVRAERIAATRDLQGERRAVVAAVDQERIAALKEIESIAERLLDRTGGPLNEAVRNDLTELVRAVEDMRKRTINDAGLVLNRVVDHAFLRALELLLIAAGLGAVGVVLYLRFLRR